MRYQLTNGDLWTVRERFDVAVNAIVEINVIPLVDIMLVLLIIFMITAPMIQRGTEVKLPVSMPCSTVAITLSPSRRRACSLEIATNGASG